MEQYKSTHTGEQIDTAVDKVINEDLPIASSTKLGGVKVGENLSITSDGVLSASGGSSGGGTKLYKHYLKGTFSCKKITDGTTYSNYLTFTLITTKSNAYTTLYSILGESYKYPIISLSVSDDYYDKDYVDAHTPVYMVNIDGYVTTYYYVPYGKGWVSIDMSSPTDFSDTVTEL